MRIEPYHPLEKKVVAYLDYLFKGAIGGGDDPVGFLIASHERIALERLEAKNDLREAERMLDMAYDLVMALKELQLDGTPWNEANALAKALNQYGYPYAKEMPGASFESLSDMHARLEQLETENAELREKLNAGGRKEHL